MLCLFDTNAVVKALYGKHMSYVLRALSSRLITPVYHQVILAEYVEVLGRMQAYIPQERAAAFFVLLQEHGQEVQQLGRVVALPDPDDVIFARVADSPELANKPITLITDNSKHFQGASGLHLVTFQQFTRQLITHIKQ